MVGITKTDPLNLRGRSVAPPISIINIASSQEGGVDPEEVINKIGAPSSYTTSEGSD